MDRSQSTIAVLLDLSKAFDTNDHDILLTKLYHYGIRGVALGWFRSYKNNKTQYITYKDCNSEIRDLVCGVPQGSVLGPLLFIIYANDLPNSLNNSKCTLFVDDITVYELLKSIESDMRSIYDWFCCNELSLNVSKTNSLVFCAKRNQIYPIVTSISLGDQTIQRQNTAKFLGIWMDYELQWEKHITHISCKISSGSYAIKSAKTI